IEINPNQIVTNHLKETVQVVDGMFTTSIEKDQLKLAVIERHKATGNVGVGIVKGFKLKKGAIASTIAHDSHNIVVVGTNDEDMIGAVENVTKTNGGLVIVDEGKVIASLALPIAGLMANESYEDVYKSLKALNEGLHAIGEPTNFNPF